MKKTSRLKWNPGIAKWILLSWITSISFNLAAQGPYPNTGDHTVCLNSTQPYGVVLTPGSSYTWSITPLTGGNGTISNGATPNLVTVNWTSIGTAKLEVVETNASGCPGDPVSIIVTVNAVPTVTVNSSAICAGTSATITATPGTAGTYNYTWTVPAGATNPGNVASFSSGVAGTYTVIITSIPAGCSSASASGIVTINAAPTLVTNNISICGGTADLTGASVTAGSTAGLIFTYWQDAAATIPYNTPTTAIAGTYYIKGTLAAGCFAVQPVTVTVTAAPSLVINNPAPVCAPTTVDLSAVAITAGSSPGLTFTYWTDATATVPLTAPIVTTSGTYFIKATAAGGCFTIKPVSVTVNPVPAPAITGPDPVCISSGGSTTIYSTSNVAGHTYNWTIIGGNISTGGASSSVTVAWTTAGLGTIGVTETITSTGCAATVTKNITVNAKPITTPITHN